jgi:hypothetical protein
MESTERYWQRALACDAVELIGTVFKTSLDDLLAYRRNAKEKFQVMSNKAGWMMAQRDSETSTLMKNGMHKII